MSTITKKPKPYQPPPHPRQADIEKAQPPMNKGIQGVGVGKERVHGFGRG